MGAWHCSDRPNTLPTHNIKTSMNASSFNRRRCRMSCNSHGNRHRGRNTTSSVIFLTSLLGVLFGAAAPSLARSTTQFNSPKAADHTNQRSQQKQQTINNNHDNNIQLLRRHQQSQSPPRGNNKQRQAQQQQCACSPRSFTITLDLLNDCFDDTLESNGGIAETICTIEFGSVENDATGSMLVGSLEEILAQLPKDNDLLEGEENENGDETISTADDDKPTTEVIQFNNIVELNDEASNSVPENGTIESSGDGGETTGINIEVIENGTSLGKLNSNQLVPQQPMIENILADIPWLMNVETKSSTTNNNNHQTTTTTTTTMRKKKKRRNRNGERNTRLRHGKNNNNHHNDHHRRHLQSSPATPIVINSITLIEIDSTGTVINVNTTLTNVNLVTGSSFTLSSIASSLAPNIPIEDQLEFIPETGVLFMIGRNDNGEEVRGRFVWRYTNSCDADEDNVPIREGDALAWNVWSEVREQLDVFCPASGNGGGVSLVPTVVETSSPTPAATTSPPTSIDTDIPTDIPTFTPTQTPTFQPTQTPTTRTLQPTTQTPSTLQPVVSPPTPVPTESPNDPTAMPTNVVLEEPTAFPTGSPNFMSLLFNNGSSPATTTQDSIDALLNNFDTDDNNARNGKSRKPKSQRRRRRSKSHKSQKAGKRTKTRSSKKKKDSSKSRKSGKKQKNSKGGSNAQQLLLIVTDSSKESKSRKSDKRSKGGSNAQQLLVTDKNSDASSEDDGTDASSSSNGTGSTTPIKDSWDFLSASKSAKRGKSGSSKIRSISSSSSGSSSSSSKSNKSDKRR